MRDIPLPLLPVLGRCWPRGPFIMPFKTSRSAICNSQIDSRCYRKPLRNNLRPPSRRHHRLSIFKASGVVVGVTQGRKRLERG